MTVLQCICNDICHEHTAAFLWLQSQLPQPICDWSITWRGHGRPEEGRAEWLCVAPDPRLARGCTGRLLHLQSTATHNNLRFKVNMGHRNEVPGWCVKKLRRDTNLFSCQILLCALNECHHHQDAVQTRKPITSERMPSCIGEVESIHMSEFLFSNFFFVCKSCIHIGNETVAVQMCRSTSKKNQNIQFLIQALARSTRRTTTLTEHILIDTL